MQIRKILLGILLLLISTLIYIFLMEKKFEVNLLQEKSVLKIDAIVIPKKPIEFTFVKQRDGSIKFMGSFSKKETPLRFAKFFINDNLVHKLDINPNLLYDEDIVILTEQLIQIFIENFVEGSILYKDKKLLISGEVNSTEDKDRVDSILEYSSVNSFNIIKIFNLADVSAHGIDGVSDVISNLKVDVANEESIENSPNKDEIYRIISELEGLTYEEVEKKKSLQAPIPTIKKEIENRIKKEEVVKKVESIKKPIKQEKLEESVNKEEVVIEDKKNIAEVYIEQKRVEEKDIIEKSDVNEDIMSLPMVKTYGINTVMEPLKTKRPMIKEQTVHIPLDQEKIDDKIPWANLHEMDEELNGILLD